MVGLGSGSVLAGKYRLQRVLAHGGMGAVWLARHLQLDVDVAVKVMRPDYAEDDEARARFEREAKASAQLKSPYFVQVLDYGVDDEVPFIAMELLAGEELEARLRHQGRLSLAATQRIVHEITRGLGFAHDAGLIHRDLKPANIFLAREGGEEIVKILDLGVAKLTASVRAGATPTAWPPPVGPATVTGTLIGSPQFMSPEQVRNAKRVDHRSDLWSLGVIIFRCLTGRLPFADDELGGLIVAICSEPIPVASQIAPDLGPSVDHFLERALTRDPERRFQSADELTRSSRRWGPPPPSACPTPPSAPVSCGSSRSSWSSWRPSSSRSSSRCCPGSRRAPRLCARRRPRRRP